MRYTQSTGSGSDGQPHPPGGVRRTSGTTMLALGALAAVTAVSVLLAAAAFAGILTVSRPEASTRPHAPAMACDAAAGGLVFVSHLQWSGTPTAAPCPPAAGPDAGDGRHCSGWLPAGATPGEFGDAVAQGGCARAVTT